MSAPAAGLITEAPTRRVPPRAWADLSVLLALVVLGVLGFEPSFGGYGFLLAGLGGLVVGAGSGVLASYLRLNAIATALLGLAAYFLLGSALAVPGQALFAVLPSLESLSSLAVGAVFGWADIVTLRAPIGAPEYIAVVPYVATWLVAIISTSLALRWLPKHPRSVWRYGLALLGPVLIYLAGVLTGTDEPYQAGIRGVTFAVIALVWLGWRRRGDLNIQGASRAGMQKSKVVGTAVLVAAAVVVGGGVAFVTAPPNDERFVLREEIIPPFDPLDYPSPLAGFRHFSKQSTDDVIMTVEGLQVGDAIRLATMDAFTGKLWNVTSSVYDAEGSGSFALVGRKLPGQSFLTASHRSDVTITIGDYDDVWIPGVGYPTQLDFLSGGAKDANEDLRYNEATGSAVLTSGLKEGDSYRVQSRVQAVLTAQDLDETPVAAMTLPGVEGSPDVITAKAQELSDGLDSPAAKLEAIRRYLIDNGFLSHGLASDSVASRAGHGADRIEELFTRNQMIGDQEQYASAFALMARSLGFPARVVLGFVPEVTGDGPVEVLGSDVTAWVEVAFEDTGWVAFDPTPEETDIPQDQTPKPQTKPQPQVRQPPRAEKDDEELLTAIELDETNKDDLDLPFSLPGWVIAIGIGIAIPAAILLIPALIVAILKARRARRRRRSGRADEQIAGAWDELLDRYTELGFAVPERLTRIRVAEELGTSAGDTEGALRSLATRTDEAVFSGAEIEPERATAVWTEVDATANAARSATTGARRLLSRYRLSAAGSWFARLRGRVADDQNGSR